MVHLVVVDDDGAVADGPPVGELAVEGHAGTSAGLVAHDGGLGAALHALDEVVGCGIDVTVGEDDDGLLPADSVGGGIEVFWLWVGEVVVSGACLVGDVADEELLVGEVGGECVGLGELSASVVPHVDDDAPAGGEVVEHDADVSVADSLLEGLAADVADVVVEDDVFESGGYLVVVSEVEAGYAVVVVFGVVFEEAPVASEVEACADVDVSVLKFAEHVAEHLEELDAGHVFVHLGGVSGVDFVPIHANLLLLVVEETVVLVHDFPQGLEGSLAGVVVVVFPDAGGGNE